jgi:uncharacterized protein (DUF1697 family)
METYISMLRGINVGGHKQVDMEGLKALFEELGFKGVSEAIKKRRI